MNECWEALRAAIVWQGAVDYLEALQRLETCGRRDRSRNQDSIRDLEDFFHSAWYRQLCELDGGMMISKLQEVFENDRDGIFAAGFLPGAADPQLHGKAGRTSGFPIRDFLAQAAG